MAGYFLNRPHYTHKCMQQFSTCLRKYLTKILIIMVVWDESQNVKMKIFLVVVTFYYVMYVPASVFPIVQ